jgi:hypothetical protein
MRLIGVGAVLGYALVTGALTGAADDSASSPWSTAAPPGAAVSTDAPDAVSLVARAVDPRLPDGTRRVYPKHILVAFYGTAQTPAMGVLGEAPPDRITKRLRAAARPYRASGRKVQIVYELIATIADRHPGRDGDYSHFIPRRAVKKYVRAARRNDALLVLDLQPGRSTFLEQARAFRWALKYPFVGLALDPEWRMGPGQVPAEVIGSVRAREINRVSKYVARITRVNNLPQKVFVIHQFRTAMVRNIDAVRIRKRLAMVQHVDGFGTQRQKRATYRAVARPGRFHMGLKLFYDEDVDMFTPRETLRIRPRVKFVSYQ